MIVIGNVRYREEDARTRGLIVKAPAHAVDSTPPTEPAAPPAPLSITVTDADGSAPESLNGQPSTENGDADGNAAPARRSRGSRSSGRSGGDSAEGDPGAEASVS